MRAVCEFRVVDESPEWIVVEKPAPLLVHPANARREPTLLGGLEALLGFELAGGARLSILTRLDRETSGLVLVAKNREAAADFGRQFEDRQVAKDYLAIVHGHPVDDAFTVDAPLRREGELRDTAIWLRQCVDAGGRPSRTDFELVRRFRHPRGAMSLLRCRPHTGRMHQLRVHLAHAGHPIVGDKLYLDAGAEYLEEIGDGLSDASVERLVLPRHALHASRLALRFRGEPVAWDSPLPADLATLLPHG